MLEQPREQVRSGMDDLRGEWSALERALEREARMLDELEGARPGAAALSATRAAVRVEALRLRRTGALAAALRVTAAAAAALLLLTFVPRGSRAPAGVGVADDPAVALQECLADLDASGALLSMIVADPAAAADRADEAELNELLESLDESLSLGAG
jgi:hypothetical protein